jgi:hypothetical protein
MLDDYFYKAEGAEIGPIQWDDLKWLADHGKLDRNALVRKGHTGKWLLAKRIKGLIDLSLHPIVLPGAPPPPGNESKTTEPVAPPRPRDSIPTISFTAAKDALNVALPPKMSPSSVKSPAPAPPKKTDKPKSPPPAAPVAPPAGPPPAGPPLPSHFLPQGPTATPPRPRKTKPSLPIDDLLPPSAIPKHPPKG